MEIDIIEIDEEKFKKLSVARRKLIRTAQQKKDALQHKMEEQLQEYKALTYANGTYYSSLYEAIKAELEAEFDYQVEILREQVIFDVYAKDPTYGQEMGYEVDPELSYLHRYNAVRDYYLTIEDPKERLNLYRADVVAMDYLGEAYYNTLFNYFYGLSLE